MISRTMALFGAESIEEVGDMFWHISLRFLLSDKEFSCCIHFRAFDTVKDIETDDIRFYHSLWNRGRCLSQLMTNGEKIVLIEKKMTLKRVRKTIGICSWIMSSPKSLVCFSLFTMKTTKDREEKSNAESDRAQSTNRCQCFNRIFRACPCIDPILLTSDRAALFHRSWRTYHMFPHASAIKQ